MPGQNVPSGNERIGRSFSRAAPAKIPSLGRLQGGIGPRPRSRDTATNPIGVGAQGGDEYDENGKLILPPEPTPATLGGLILQGLTAGRREDYAAQKEGAHAAFQEKMQQGFGTYIDLLNQTNSPSQALGAFLKTPEGQAIFMDRDALRQFAGIHSFLQQQLQTPEDFGVHELPGGLKVVTGPGMKPQMVKPDKDNLSPLQTDKGYVTFNHKTGQVSPLMAGQGGQKFNYDSQGNILPQDQSQVGTQLQPPIKGAPKDLLGPQADKLSAAANLYEALGVMKATAPAASGLPMGPIYKLGAEYGGINEPAELYSIAKTQAINNASLFYSGRQGLGYKEFIENLPDFTQAANFNVGLANNLRGDIWRTTRDLASIANNRLKGFSEHVPELAQDLETRMGIYVGSHKSQDALTALRTNTQTLTTDQLEELDQNADRMTPKEYQAYQGEVARRHQNYQQQSQANPQGVTSSIPQGAPPPTSALVQGGSLGPSVPNFSQQMGAGLPGIPPAAPSPGPHSEATPEGGGIGSVLAALNPIGSAEAATIEPQYPGAMASFRPEAPPPEPGQGAYEEVAPREAPVAPMENPMQKVANEAMAGPGPEELSRQTDAAALIRQAHDLLMQTGPTEK